MSRVLTLADSVKVANWMTNNKDTLVGKTYKVICELVFTDTGVKISSNTAGRMLKDLGISLGIREPQSKSGRDLESTITALALLAKVVRRIAEETKTPLSEFEREGLVILGSRRPLPK
jgi:hypothetical protein